MRRGATVFLAVLVAACGSSSSSSSSSTSATCPDVSGTWHETQQPCDSPLANAPLVITQKGCTLSFAAPFDGFSSSLASDGTLSITGGSQSCNGTASSSSIALSCSPGTCRPSLVH